MSQPYDDTRPMPFRILLDAAMKLTRRHFRRLYWPAALSIAGIYAVMGVGYGASFGPMMEAASTNPESADAADVFGNLLIGCGVIVPLLLFAMVIWLALMSSAYDATTGRQKSFSDHLWYWLKPARWGTMVLAGFLIGLGFLACVAPGLYLGLAFAFVIVVVRAEGLTGWGACKRSSELVRYNPQGNFLDAPIVKVFVLLLVGTLISYGLTLLFQLPLTVLQQLMLFREMGAESSGAGMPAAFFWIVGLSMVLSAFTSTLVQLYQGFGLALLYLDTRRRREGSDLEAAIDALDGGALAGGAGVPLP